MPATTKPAEDPQDLEDWQTVIGCLFGVAKGRDFLMHARDGRIKVLNRRDATIKRNSRLGCSVVESRSYTGLLEVIFKP